MLISNATLARTKRVRAVRAACGAPGGMNARAVVPVTQMPVQRPSQTLRVPPRSAAAPSRGDVRATIRAERPTARDHQAVPAISSGAMAWVK